MNKIAAIQLCSSDCVDDNLVVASTLIAEAAANGAKLAVLPEIFAFMGTVWTEQFVIAEKYGEGKIQRFLSQQAKAHQIWLVGGTIPIKCETDKTKIRAASLVINSHGEVVARYDKVHLFDVVVSNTQSYQESAGTQAGETVVVVDTPLGRLGVAVCYDIRFPEQFIRMQQLGAEIIAVPAAFTQPTGEAHWQLLTRARAVDIFAYIVGADQSGQHSNGVFTYGHSLIVSPWGEVVASAAATGNTVIYATIDLETLHIMRQKIPLAQHRKAASI